MHWPLSANCDRLHAVGIFRSNDPVSATFDGKAIACVICGSGQFTTREIKLNSTGMELLDLGWANASATGLICVACGFVHEFAGNALELWEA